MWVKDEKRNWGEELATLLVLSKPLAELDTLLCVELVWEIVTFLDDTVTTYDDSFASGRLGQFDTAR